MDRIFSSINQSLLYLSEYVNRKHPCPLGLYLILGQFSPDSSNFVTLTEPVQTELNHMIIRPSSCGSIAFSSSCSRNNTIFEIIFRLFGYWNKVKNIILINAMVRS